MYFFLSEFVKLRLNVCISFFMKFLHDKIEEHDSIAHSNYTVEMKYLSINQNRFTIMALPCSSFFRFGQYELFVNFSAVSFEI